MRTPDIGIFVPTVSPGSQLTLSPNHKLTTTVTYDLPVPVYVGHLAVVGTMTHTSRQASNHGIPTFLGVIPLHTLINLNVN